MKRISCIEGPIRVKYVKESNMQFLIISSTLSYYFFLDYVAHNLLLHFRIRSHYVVSSYIIFMNICNQILFIGFWHVN